MQAATLHGAAQAHGYWLPADRVIYDRLESRYVAPARAVLGADAWDRAEQTGARMTYEQAIASFMDARHIARASVVGHSMGSLVAQELGLSYPGRLSRLVLISTGADGQVDASSITQAPWSGEGCFPRPSLTVW